MCYTRIIRDTHGLLSPHHLILLLLPLLPLQQVVCEQLNVTLHKIYAVAAYHGLLEYNLRVFYLTLAYWDPLNAYHIMLICDLKGK